MQQELETEQFEQSYINRSLALHNEYRSWGDLITSGGTDPEFLGDIRNDRVPVIALSCGDDYHHNPKLNLVDIANGLADNDLILIREQLQKLAYTNGTEYPVMVRWFWEFNLNITNPQDDPNNNNGCFQVPNPPTIPSYPAQFINAWIRVRSVLLGTGSPVPNISFIWDPSIRADGYDTPDTPWAYYPGGQYVDWVGFDGYSKLPNNIPPAETFDQIFGTPIAYVAQNFGKPVVITETGACNAYPPPFDQASYINTIRSAIDSGVYPNLYAFMYFDAPSQHYSYQNKLCDWSLQDNSNSAGMTAFRTMAADTKFSATIPRNP